MIERKPPSGDADGFLGRWSRRKFDSRKGEPLAEPPVAPTRTAEAGFAAPIARTANREEGLDLRRDQSEAGTVQPEAPPPPTLADVQALTAGSDFTPFMARGVTPAVRNAAMKKLFADPHFNVMDGLDVYIDDYTKTTPLTAAMIKRMDGARFLKLFDGDGDGAPRADAAKQQASQADGADRLIVSSDHGDFAGPRADPAEARMEPIDDKRVGARNPSAASSGSHDPLTARSRTSDKNET